MHSIYHPKPPIPRYSHISFQRGTAIDTSRFLGALNQLNQDDDDDDSSLQEELMASDGEHIPPSPSSPQDWRPPSPSEFENVIDQHILCRSNRGSTVHWPARVVAYIPPTKSSQKPRFTVDFFDWKTTEVTRDMFFTQYDEDEKGFATCEVCFLPFLIGFSRIFKLRKATVGSTEASRMGREKRAVPRRQRY